MQQEPINKITMEQIEMSYRGKSGCACGCGGDYLYIEVAANEKEIAKHINYINNNLMDANFFGTGVEVYAPNGNTVTRLYFTEDTLWFKTDTSVIKVSETRPNPFTGEVSA
jgi:hypothetical protein